jgi:putative ABC transport system permease protein
MRRPTRALLTTLGVALAVALLVGVESFSAGMQLALESGDKAHTLVVYRKNRFCPQTSFLPERYVEEISSIDGVESVLPVKVLLNNCRTSLDLVTFHGTPVEEMLAARDIHVLRGDVGAFRDEADAALVGWKLAQRRGLSVGDKFRFGDITVKVAGIFQSSDSTLEGILLTHLEFLQRAGPVKRLGTVTQFEVRITDPSRAQDIAHAIDARLKHAEEPTQTRSMAAFLKRATADLREILRFGHIFGAICVLVIMVLVANTIFMAVHERRREFGVLRAIGFRAPDLASMVLAEAGAIALTGGVLGLVGMFAVIRSTGIAIGVEGVQVSFALTPSVAALGIGLVLGGALLAALIPAIGAARVDVVRAIRGGI